jgi:hypothetical protein
VLALPWDKKNPSNIPIKKSTRENVASKNKCVKPWDKKQGHKNRQTKPFLSFLFVTPGR